MLNVMENPTLQQVQFLAIQIISHDPRNWTVAEAMAEAKLRLEKRALEEKLDSLAHDRLTIAMEAQETLENLKNLSL